MSEALSFPEESRASFETPATELAPDLSDREFLTEEEKRVLIAKIQAGLNAQEQLASGVSVPDSAGLEQLAEQGRVAEAVIVETHIRLAMKISNGYYGPGMSPNDLFQHAQIGLLKAAREFDPTTATHVKFHEYAANPMREEILKTIATKTRLIKLPENDFWLAPKIAPEQERLRQQNGHPPSDKELAESLHVKISQIVALRPVARDAVAILDAPISNDSLMTVKDRIAHDETTSGEGHDSDRVANPRLRAALGQLTEYQRAIIEMRNGLNGYPNMHREDIGSEINIAPKNVARAEDRIRRRLRVIMDSDMDNAGPSEDEEREKPEISGLPAQLEKREYDPFATPLLDVRDGSWLMSLMGRAPSSETLREMNELILSGSQILTGRYALVDDEARRAAEESIEARSHFFEKMGWLDAKHPMHDAFMDEVHSRNRFPILDRFIFTQRALSIYGVQARHVLKAKPDMMYSTPHYILDRVQAVDELGLNAGKIFTKQPAMFAYGPDRLRSTADVLTRNGIDIVKTLELLPRLFEPSPVELENRIENLRDNGFDVSRTVGRNPNVILRLSPAAFNDKIRSFEQLGLDPKIIMPAAPGVLTYNIDTIRSKLAQLDEFGLDSMKLVHKRPSLLGSDMDKVERRIHLLDRIAKRLQWQGGINELIISDPGILQYAQTKIFLLGHIAANHLDAEARTMPAGQIADALKLSPESHLIATSRPHENYSVNMTRQYQRAFTKEKREFVAQNTLEDPEAVKRIGSKVVTAYNRHTSSKKK